ncbi:MAG: succinate dehydrogenase / fumarate reductase, cytochrome b subunit [Clostridia bacterium]|nr:succinate dehydrogenase / fumarate reductase, cytochrome b subunit [Clostridia bacterium]
MWYYRSFFWRKLHSLTGVIPVGLFLLEHFTVNSFATRGPEAYNRAVAFLQGLPFLLAIEIVFIFLPLALHAGYGLWVVYTGSINVRSYPYFRNWMYLLQRVTGVIVLLFLIYHIYALRLARIFTGAEVSFEQVAAHLASPLVLALYVPGLLAAIFHLSNGLVTWAIGWGIITGPKAQTGASIFGGIIFCALTVVGFSFLLAFI